MKLREEFEVAESVASVWSFFEQTEQVAKCVPGVEDVTVHGPDDIEARLTQSVGPMTATFAGSVRIVERVPQKRLSFTATGKSVRGASGNVRANVEVTLEERADRAAVVVEAELALAGPLGSVGQKVVAKQAGKVTAAFSRNLEQALGGTAAAAPDEVGSEQARSEKTKSGTSPDAEPAARADTHAAVAAAQRWGKVAAACSAASLVVSLVSLWRNLRAGAR